MWVTRLTGVSWSREMPMIRAVNLPREVDVAGETLYVTWLT